jgi:phospholipase C
VFDHTSPLQFLERLLTHKTGRPITETNITQWRRTVCGDLTSAFQRQPDDKQAGVPVPQRDAFLEGIHRAKFKQPPSNFRPLSQAEIDEIRRDPQRSALLPRQEPGVRRSCALPYELVVDGQLSDDRSAYHIRFEARNEVFGPAAAGAPFAVRAWTASDDVAIRDYAVVAGGRLSDSWPLSDFDSGAYHFTVHGPNGFFRAFRGAAADPLLEIRLDYARPTSGVAKLTGDVAIRVFNRDPRRSHAVDVVDNAYKSDPARVVVPPNESASVPVSAQRAFGWYDRTVRVAGVENFEKRYAGRVETGQWSFSDPAMGGVVA